MMGGAAFVAREEDFLEAELVLLFAAADYEGVAPREGMSICGC